MVFLFLCEELSSGPCLGLRSSLVFKLVFHSFPYLTSLIGWRSSLFEPLPNWPFKFSQTFPFLSRYRSLLQAAGFLFVLISISLPWARIPGTFNCAWDLVHNASSSFHTERSRAGVWICRVPALPSKARGFILPVYQGSLSSTVTQQLHIPGPSPSFYLDLECFLQRHHKVIATLETPSSKGKPLV